MELGDPGMQWSRRGATLHIRRRLTPHALLWPTVMVAVVAFIAWRSFQTGDWLMGSFMSFALIFPLAFLAMRVVNRAEIIVDADRIRWRQERPRPFEGSWDRDQIDGLRVYVHAKSKWLEPRQAHVELRVDGSWETFVFGGRRKRAERLAEDLALVLALSPQVEEAES